MLFEAKFDEYSKLKKFRDVDGCEFLLKKKIHNFIDFNIDMQIYVKLSSTLENLFSDEGLSYKSVEREFAKFSLDKDLKKYHDESAVYSDDDSDNAE